MLRATKKGRSFALRKIEGEKDFSNNLKRLFAVYWKAKMEVIK